MDFGSTVEMNDLSERLALLGEEHRNLDSTIAAMLAANDLDQLQLARLKKRKLRLRDEIERLRDLLRPDIIA